MFFGKRGKLEYSIETLSKKTNIKQSTEESHIKHNIFTSIQLLEKERREGKKGEREIEKRERR